MKKIYQQKFFIFVLLIAPLLHKTSVAQPGDQEKYRNVPGTDTPKISNSIALLGVYHFENPNLDAFNVRSDNVLNEKRQKEIQQLVQELAKFKPTRIVLEYDASKTEADERYRRYLAGEYELGPGEGEQIGFRLAKLLGHPHIYPADERNLNIDFNPGELGKDYGSLLQQLGKEGNKAVAQINDWIKNNSIGVALSKLNAPEIDLLNIDLYYKYILPVGKAGQYPGAEAVARWYKRNLLIFHHIINLLEKDKENRIMVIFGQGHTAMLNQFLEYSSIFKKEDIRHYLPKSDQ